MAVIPGSITIAGTGYDYSSMKQFWADVLRDAIIGFMSTHVGANFLSGESTGETAFFDGGRTGADKIRFRWYARGTTNNLVLLQIGYLVGDTWTSTTEGSANYPQWNGGNVTISLSKTGVLTSSHCSITGVKQVTLPPAPGDTANVSVRVQPVNVARTVTLAEGYSLTLAAGATVGTYANIPTGTVMAPTVTASGYETYTGDIFDLVDDTALDIVLWPLEVTGRVRIKADCAADITVSVNGGAATPCGQVPCYYDAAPGDSLQVTATYSGKTEERTVIVEDLVTDVFFRFMEGGGEPPEAPAIPTPTAGAMTARVWVQCPGTLSYDNDGVLNDPEPITVTGPGYIDYELPAPMAGSTGGVLSFDAPGFGESTMRVVFVADGTTEAHLGPGRVTVTGPRPFEVFFDRDDMWQWLPGDGEFKGSGTATTGVSFLVDRSGCVNIAVLGTSLVIRHRYYLDPGNETRYTLETAQLPADEGGVAEPAGPNELLEWVLENWQTAAVVVIVLIIVLVLLRFAL